MRAAVLDPDGSVTVQVVDDPSPGPRDLLLRVTGCGVCGSDLAARPVMSSGTIMGHEMAGEVVGAGAEVRSSWSDGDRVAVLPVFACLDCGSCRAGHVAHCHRVALIGLGGGHGGFAELVRVSADLSFRLPASVQPLHGPLVEPYAVGLHVAHAAEIRPGDRVLVIGAGAVGLTTATWVRSLGAETVVVSDPAPARLASAESFDIDAVHDPTAGPIDGTFDVVVDCAGKPGLLDVACSAAVTHGRIVVAGVCYEPDTFVPLVPMLKELSIRYAIYYQPSEFQTVVDAFARGTIDPSPLITRSAPLSELDALLARPSADDVKVVVDPSL